MTSEFTDDQRRRRTDDISTDQGYSVMRCKSAISACSALSVTSGERNLWDNKKTWWERQLTFAEKRERVSG